MINNNKTFSLFFAMLVALLVVVMMIATTSDAVWTVSTQFQDIYNGQVYNVGDVVPQHIVDNFGRRNGLEARGLITEQQSMPMGQAAP